jgi:holin-like protein
MYPQNVEQGGIPGRLRISILKSIDALRGFAILVAFYLLGLVLCRAGIPIPGGVLGLMIFYLAMTLGLVKLSWVERAANLLLRHMVLLFVPVTVGLMEVGRVLAQQAVALIASLLVSCVAVLLTTGLLGRQLLPSATGSFDGLPVGAEEEV